MQGSVSVIFDKVGKGSSIPDEVTRSDGIYGDRLEPGILALTGYSELEKDSDWAVRVTSLAGNQYLIVGTVKSVLTAFGKAALEAGQAAHDRREYIISDDMTKLVEDAFFHEKGMKSILEQGLADKNIKALKIHAAKWRAEMAPK